MSHVPKWMTWPFSDLFEKPSIPEIPPSPPPPVTTAEEEAALKEEEKKKIRQGRTKAGTILTSPVGLLEPAETKRKTLLGE